MTDRVSAPLPDGRRWTKEQAHNWYNQQSFMNGANYIPSDAVNQIEMWQSFNPDLIDRELGYLQKAGMTDARVFMHNLVYDDNAAQFKQNLDTYLSIADQHNIRTLLVAWDSVWSPVPTLGPQPEARPGLHNSGWVQSPGLEAMSNPSYYGQMQTYIEDVTATFGHDKRVLGWDIWNEPDNLNNGSYNESPAKWNYVAPLLKDSFQWARNAKPQQFLTSGVWINYRDDFDKLHPIFQIQLAESDIISFHSYDPADVFADNIKHLQDTYERPVICTEYMARENGSRFETHLPVALDNKVGMFCWGAVQGKTNTHCNWLSWEKHHAGESCAEPESWFHDIFKADGTYHSAAEETFFMNFKETVADKETLANQGGPNSRIAQPR